MAGISRRTFIAGGAVGPLRHAGELDPQARDADREREVGVYLRPMSICMQPSHTDRDTRVEVERA